MKKWKLILFYIATFSIGYFYIKSKAKKVSEDTTINEELEVRKEIPFEVNKLVSILNGIENIKSCSSTINSLKVELNSIENINIDEIKKIGAKGVMKSGNKLTMLFGDFSKTLDQFINELINENSKK